MSTQAGFTACWKCEEPLACADVVEVLVVGLTVNVMLCKECEGALDDLLEGRAPTPLDLAEWKNFEQKIYEPARVSITMRDKTTGEVLGHFGDPAPAEFPLVTEEKK